MRRLLLLTAAVLLLAPAVAQARTSLVEVPVDGPADVRGLLRDGFDVTEDVSARHARLILHDDAERRRLTAAGFPAREVIADLEAYHRRLRAAERGKAQAGARSNLPSGRETYRVLADYYNALDGLASKYPGLVRRVSLPRASVQGRELAGVEIAANVNRADDGRPVYVVMGAHHAREWPSAEVNMEWALDLASQYGVNDRFTKLLQNVRVFVFPVVNPDGFVMSRGENPLLPQGVDNLQRKNANEVDLNRNYGAYWGGNGASNDPASDIYRGPSPWSEPESAAVHEFSQGLHITNFQSIHNIASLVLRPPGFRALGLAPDEARLKELGDRMADATGYASEYGYELYEVTGATEDWNYVAQNSFGYTIELGGFGSFQGPYATNVVQQYLGRDMAKAGGDGVREALLMAGEQAGDVRDHSLFTGTATPGATIRLRRSFETATSPVCEGSNGQPYDPSGDETCPVTGPAQVLPDRLDTTLTVPSSGRYSWHVTPSTRPFVRKAGRSEAWTLSCEVGGQVVDARQIVIGIGEHLDGDPCVPGSTFTRVGAPAAAPDPVAAPAGAPVTPTVPGVRPLRLSLRLDSRQRRATVLRRGALVRATCPLDCTVATSVRRSSRGSVLGRRSLRLRAGKRLAFRVKLSRAGRRYVARRGVRRIVVRLDARSGTQRAVSARGITLVTR